MMKYQMRPLRAPCATYADLKGRELEFASPRHVGTAMYLDAIGVDWYYRDLALPYIDMMTGKHRQFIIDFTLLLEDGEVVWLETKHESRRIPNDARIYASRRAEDAGVLFRGLTDMEIAFTDCLWAVEYRRSQVKFRT